MKITIDNPELQVVLRLRPYLGGVALTASAAGSANDQDIMLFTAQGAPSPGDPLGERDEFLTVQTIKLDPNFPAKLDLHSHVEITRKP